MLQFPWRYPMIHRPFCRDMQHENSSSQICRGYTSVTASHSLQALVRRLTHKCIDIVQADNHILVCKCQTVNSGRKKHSRHLHTHDADRHTHCFGMMSNLTISIPSCEVSMIVSVIVEGLTVGGEFLLEQMLPLGFVASHYVKQV